MNWAPIITRGVSAAVTLGARVTIHGQEHVPMSGPVIVVSNHLSWADPAIFVGRFPRHIVFMAKEELWRNPFLRMLGLGHGDILVRRGEADRQAIKAAQAALDKGLAFAILPEGTRSKEATLQRGQPGAAFIALRAGVPILPAAMWGTERIKKPVDLLQRRKVILRYGEPFSLEGFNRKDLQGATDHIMRKVAVLLPERYRGVYRDEVTV